MGRKIRIIYLKHNYAAHAQYSEYSRIIIFFGGGGIFVFGT